VRGARRENGRRDALSPLPARTRRSSEDAERTMEPKMSKAHRQAMIIMIAYVSMAIFGVTALVVWLRFLR